jgi:hypothetical protein
MEDFRLQRRYADVLMNIVEQTRYPSAEVMNRVETSVGDRAQGEKYVELLLDKLADTRYPSLQMLDRIDNMVRRLG